LHGQCVQLVQGERATKKEYGDPVTCAVQWVETGAAVLHKWLLLAEIIKALGAPP